jgi:hypothetical protein
VHLGKFLESRRFQFFIIGLIFLDLAILVTELILVREDKEPSDTIQTVEEVLYWATVGILAIFSIEVILLMVAFGKRFFKQPLYLL